MDGLECLRCNEGCGEWVWIGEMRLMIGDDENKRWGMIEGC